MKERNLKICELYRQGATKQQLCEQFGISKRTLSRVLSAQGLIRGKRSSLSTEAKNDVISAYLEGLPVYKLAEQYDTSEYQIERCLEEANVSRRGLGESQTASKQVELDQRYDEILALLLDGNLTLREVAQKLGIHWSSLRDFRNRHGLDADRRSLEGYRPKGREKLTVIEGRKGLDFEAFLKTLGLEYDKIENEYYFLEYKCLFIYIEDTNGYTRKQLQNRKLKTEAVELFYIFEYEWNTRQKQIASFVRSQLGLFDVKVGARDCDIREVEFVEGMQFLDEYHLMGAGIRGRIYLGLYYNNDLKSLLVLGPDRFGTGSDWEILRFVSKSGWLVRGGFSRLFSNFLKMVSSNIRISTYVDFNKSRNTSVYEKCGFEFERITKPDYVWVSEDNLSVATPYNSQRKKLIELGHSDSLTEVEIMESLGFQRLWRSGNLVYSYKH